MWNNVFYFSHLNEIGGIEQFFAYLAEKYQDKDITIVYRTGHKSQINRLSKFVRVVKYDGAEIQCKKAFFCFNIDIRNKVIADEYILLLHGDYLEMVRQGQLSKTNPIFAQSFDKYYGVSQTVCDGWKQLTGKDCEVLYNPIIKYPPKKLIKLVYCGRLTPEKGGDLITKFLTALDDKKVDYRLYVYSNKKPFDNPNVVYLNTRLDAGQFLNKHNYDYIIVPSKNEGYCYSLIQALSNGLPAIVTPCPVFKELGVNNKNSITLNFNGSNCDEVIEKMLNTTFNFKYEPLQDRWNDVLVDAKSTYDNSVVEITSVKRYFDLDLGKSIAPNTSYTVLHYRAKQLIDAGVAIKTESI